VTAADLRARVRELVAAGVLPKDPPIIQRVAEVGARRQQPCAICAEPDPTISYFWTAGVMVCVHAACDALWKQEQASPPS
jgi:hypothetical protein